MTTSSTSALPMESEPRATLLATVWASAPDFWTLTKPEVNVLIVIATFTGFYLGCPNSLPSFPFAKLFHSLCGTLLVASGAGALNQYLEYRFDAQMRRTCKRPIPSGRLQPATALWFGASLSICGAIYLLVAVNTLTSLLAASTLTSYLAFYTPLKRQTPLCTFVGAVPGAMPILIGWSAVSGSASSETAWILFALLFLWQFPHFMAIAWMYREDYAKAEYLMLPPKNESRFLAWVTLVPSFTLFIVAIIAVAENSGALFQYAATVLLGCGLLYCAMQQGRLRSRIAARRLLKATIIYLPLEFLVLVLGKELTFIH